MARRGSPVIVLVSMSITVSMALAVGWQWAESKTKLPAAESAVLQPGDTDGLALTTPVLSVRRAPAVLSRRLDVTAFQQSLQPLLAGLNNTSCVAVSVDGQLIAQRTATLPVIPASNMKLVTAAVAVEVLGAFFIYTTTVTGEIGTGGVVNGDIYLVGGGDPLLTTDDWLAASGEAEPPINTTRLEDLADAVVARGVTQITGNVVGDGSRYDDEWFAPSWGNEVKGSESGPYDALMVNDVTDKLADPAQNAAQTFLTLLQQRGVRIDGEGRSGTALDATELASVNSHELALVVQELLTTSDNNTAEMLLKEIGLESSGVGSREAGSKVVQTTLQQWDVPTNGIVLADGSGLSNDNRLTCAAVLAVLQHGSSDDVVGQGLPIAGVSGTLADSFLDSPLKGRLIAKTGTLANSANTTRTSDPPAVKALSGYVVVDGGGTIEFSLILNGQTVTDIGEFGKVWYEQLGPALASYPATATVGDLSPR